MSTHRINWRKRSEKGLLHHPKMTGGLIGTVIVLLAAMYSWLITVALTAR